MHRNEFFAPRDSIVRSVLTTDPVTSGRDCAKHSGWHLLFLVRDMQLSGVGAGGFSHTRPVLIHLSKKYGLYTR